MPDNQPSQFALDMDAELASRRMQESTQPGKGMTTEQFAQQFEQLTREAGVAELNPIAAEKVQRDAEYQRQMETIPQPSVAPPVLPVSTPELDRLDQLQQELDAAKAESAKFKRLYGQKTGEIGVLRRDVADLQARVGQIQPMVSVKQMTGKEPGEYITAEDVANLLLSQSQAMGNALRQQRDELLQQGYGQQQDGLPLDLEAELVESHPWLSDLPRPNRLRAMHDILATAGVSVTPPAGTTPAQQATRQVATLPEAARKPVRQVAYIEPSNRGSTAERDAIAPERAAMNEKVAKLREILTGPYKPGLSDKAAELLSALGAGPIDETQGGVFQNWRGR